ncbi:23S rRNA (uracil(1939)-C(5))-methyltransferase RlmD [Compostibacter hankyongensis]|uniref:23S rRNA (Uracil(1939)-C(5))-methyltransferase RlmD n=1 Tax=Compostibacter hankyongensis TaxID=1007089 RepID=A0ABP8G4J1_9BACT
MRKKTVRILENVTVSDYAAEGRSLARVDGKVCFISGAVPGDVVDVRVVKSKKDWAEGYAVQFHAYSPQRTDPFCAHFGTCGGCKWQMLPYEAQLRYKQQQVEQHLQRIGHLTLPPAEPICGAAETVRYRNKLEFTFSDRAYLDAEAFARQQEAGTPPAPALGFHIPGLFDKVLDIAECHLQEEPSNRIRNTVRAYALAQGLPFYNLRTHEGWLRNLIIRNSTTGGLMVNLCLHHEDKAAREALLDHLLREVPAITTLLYTLNPKRNDSIFDLEPVTYYGEGYIREQLEDFTFKIGPKSFFQTNTRQAEQLYGIVRDFAGLQGTETVYDLYCGTGSIGIFLSRQAARITGVELIGEAVRDARENAAVNKVSNALFFEGDAAEICTPDFFAAQGLPDVVITDPPRAGMHEKLVRQLLEMQAPKVVYVSCNPATQARDLQLLSERYRVSRYRPVDMFPHTHHIENVALLEWNP